jgi:hypothetical protein
VRQTPSDAHQRPSQPTAELSRDLRHDTRTAIYYMNTSACEEADGAAATAWDVERLGGAIRLYDGLEQPSHTDVAPVGDRLLVFWSDSARGLTWLDLA